MLIQSAALLICILGLIKEVTAISLPSALLVKRSHVNQHDYSDSLLSPEAGNSSPEEVQSVYRKPRSAPRRGRNGMFQRQPSLRSSAPLIDWPSSEDEQRRSYQMSEGPSLATVYALRDEDDDAQSKMSSMMIDTQIHGHGSRVGEDFGYQSDGEYSPSEAEEEGNAQGANRYVQDWSYYDSTASMSAAQDYNQSVASQFREGEVDPTTKILIRLAQRKHSRRRVKGAWHESLPDKYKDILEAFCEKTIMKKGSTVSRQSIPRAFQRLKSETVKSVIDAYKTKCGWELNDELDGMISELSKERRAMNQRGYDKNWSSMHKREDAAKLRAIGKASGRVRADGYLRSIGYERRMEALKLGSRENLKLKDCRPWRRVGERIREGEDEEDGSQD